MVLFSSQLLNIIKKNYKIDGIGTYWEAGGTLTHPGMGQAYQPCPGSISQDLCDQVAWPRIKSNIYLDNTWHIEYSFLSEKKIYIKIN